MTGHPSTAPRLDIEALREDTPGTGHRTHLNNAGAGLMPRPVIDAIQGHVTLESEIGGYEAADLRAEAVAGVYGSVGRLIGSPAANIALMENATAAFNAALSAIPLRADDVILTTKHDYVSNQIAFLTLRDRLGVRVVHAPDLPEGGVDPAAFAELVHRLRPRVATITHVPTNSGLVQPVEEIAAICRSRDVPLILDACQSVGQLDVDVRALDPDFLSATARKFLRGPRGIGFLYVSDRALERGLTPLFPDLRGADWIDADLVQPAPDARRFENWEFPFALVLGLGAACDYLLDLGVGRCGERAAALASDMRTRLSDLAGVRVLDRGSTLSAIVTMAAEGVDAGFLKSELSRRGINTSTSPREYAIFDFDAKAVPGALRISPHYYNTEEEIDALVAALAEIVG